MKLYRIKLGKYNTVLKFQNVDGYLGNAFNRDNKIQHYTKGEAIKKAKLFGGEIEEIK